MKKIDDTPIISMTEQIEQPNTVKLTSLTSLKNNTEETVIYGFKCPLQLKKAFKLAVKHSEFMTDQEAAAHALRAFIFKVAEQNDRVNIILQDFPQEPIGISDNMELTQYRSEVESTIAAINHSENDQTKIDRYKYELIMSVRKIERLINKTHNLNFRSKCHDVIKEAKKYFE